MTTTRPLGSVEASWASADTIAPINGVTYLKIKGPMTEPLAREALRQMQSRHPLTQMRAIREKGRWVYKVGGVGEIPLVIHHIKTATEHDAILQYELDTPFDCAQGPLMRCCLTFIEDEPLHTFFIMNYVHTIGDGASVLNFFKEFLTICNLRHQGSDFQIPPLPLMPPVDQLFPNELKGFANKLRAWAHIFREAKAEYWTKHIRIFEDSTDNYNEIKTGFLEMKVPENIHRKLLQSCDKNGASLHTAIAASVLIAQYEFYAKKHKTNATKSLKCISLYNLRPFLNPIVGPEHYGCFVSMIASLHKINHQTPLWELARSVQDALKQNTRQHLPFWTAKLAETMLKLAVTSKRTRIGALAISNVGRVRYNEDFGAFTIEDFVGYVSNIGVSANMVLVVFRFGGFLRWNYNYPKPLLQREEALGIALRANEILFNAAGLSAEDISLYNKARQLC